LLEQWQRGDERRDDGVGIDGEATGVGFGRGAVPERGAAGSEGERLHGEKEDENYVRVGERGAEDRRDYGVDVGAAESELDTRLRGGGRQLAEAELDKRGDLVGGQGVQCNGRQLRKRDGQLRSGAENE
jgi:hypothetical protein